MNPSTPQLPQGFDASQHGVILNDGTRVPLSDLQGQDPQLYSQYIQNLAQPAASLQQTQAAIPGTEAQSAKEQIQAQQAAALKNLHQDLVDNKMTLKTAMKKYTGLGMAPDDIFTNYLSQSPHGLPKESLTELKNLGVSDKALGQVGDLGSFADRQNMRNAVLELRNLQTTFNQTGAMAKMPFIGSSVGMGKVYEGQRQLVGQHLSSLVQGAPHAAGSSEDLMKAIPSAGDLAQLEPGESQKQFNKTEQTLLTSKGYSYKDLSLNPALDDILKTQNTGKSGGGGLLSGLLDTLRDSSPATMPGLKLAKEHPDAAIGVASVLLPALLTGGVSVAEAPEEVAAGEAVEQALSKAPGALKTLLSPGKAKMAVGDIRNTILSAANKTGAITTGENLATGIRQWADQAKLANLPDADAIEKAAQNAEQLYKGKVFKPSDLKQIYDNIENGYTKLGVEKSATSAYIDRGVKGVISNELERIAPGFQKTSEMFDKIYKSEKGVPAKIIKNLPQTAAKAGMNMAGLGVLKEVLGL